MAYYRGDTYQADISWIEPNTPCECGGCDWTGPFKKLKPIEDCELMPGDPSPAGRCPVRNCETLAYVVKPKSRRYDAADAMLVALKLAAEGLQHDEATLAVVEAAIAKAEGTTTTERST